MNYRLVVLTHGDHRADLAATLASFAAAVTPTPSSVHLRADRAAWLNRDWLEAYAGVLGCPISCDFGDAPGFCASTRRAWQAAVSAAFIPELHNAERRAVEATYTHVFWLEHDFLITRMVNLDELALVLDREPKLAQMALMRDAVNAEEKAAGGLFESRPGQYEPRMTKGESYWLDTDRITKMHEWLEHRAYLTTNPSLMRRDFMAAHPWPDYPERCEGRFGIDLVSAGYTFGVWGRGEPWCSHVGVRTGDGY